MHDLLTDRLFRVHRRGGEQDRLSLPGVYEAMVADDIRAFPSLRPHQRHAWHAFLAQLGVQALVRAERQDPPTNQVEWMALIEALTPEFPGHEPWSLVVEDPGYPAFMQCPSPNGLADYKKQKASPVDTDLLVTAKNFDVKTGADAGGQPEDWCFALISLQTMAGFGGARNYGIVRMNGGYSSRPCLALAPANGGWGAHVLHDIGQMLRARDEVLDSYPDYFDPDGAGLLWLVPWDGSTSLRLDALDPYFIEICRRVRLVSQDVGMACRTAGSRKPRIHGKSAMGDVGDHWTPVHKAGKALSISESSFRYDRLKKLLLDDEFRLPRAMRSVDGPSGGSWRLVARGVCGGQGKTDGYHERSDIVLRPPFTTSFLGSPGEMEVLGALAQAQIEEIAEVLVALGLAVSIAASGGKDAKDLTKSDRAHANPYQMRLREVVDARYFPALQERLGARQVDSRSIGADRSVARRTFARGLINSASQLLSEAVETVPCASIQRHRARARATSAFWWRLRRSDSVFSDQKGIFDPPIREELGEHPN